MPTNSFISCNVDPVGRNNGFPTDKECQMMSWDAAMAQPSNLKTTYKTTNNPDSTTSLPSGQYFTSTGSNAFVVRKNTYGVNENANYPNPANPSFTDQTWQECFAKGTLWVF